jgi:hypothetical protein
MVAQFACACPAVAGVFWFRGVLVQGCFGSGVFWFWMDFPQKGIWLAMLATAGLSFVQSFGCTGTRAWQDVDGNPSGLPIKTRFKL